jgi:hypothetical protein
MSGCVMSSENQFAVVNSTVEDMCERVPSAQNCLPEEEEPFEEDLVGPPEPPDTGDLPEDRSCNSPMRIRKIIPFENHAVPINVQPVVLTIGNGDETHLEASLQSADGQEVETIQSTTCYVHEGDEEYHCTYLIEPVTYLEPNTEYMLYVRTTDVHPNPDDVEQSFSHFTTTGSAITDVNTNPVTEIIGYMEREPTAIQECDWKESMKYEVVTAIQEETRDFLTLIQVYEVPDINSTEGDLVHSIILPREMSSTQYRQVIYPGDEYPRCYHSRHRTVTGVEWPSETVCWSE